jgi:O-antigen ligase
MSSPVSEDSLAAPSRNRSAPTRWFTAARLLRFSHWSLAVMCLLPFLIPGKVPPVPSFQAEAVAAALALLAMSVLPVFAERVELPRVALLPLAFAGLIVIQMLSGQVLYREVGLLAALYLLWATGLIILGGVFRRELGIERVLPLLAWFMLAGALLSCLIAWAQHIHSDTLARIMMPRSPGRVWANLGQHNQLADYVTLGLISAAYLYTTGRLRLRWAAAAALVLTYILSLTGSRTSWVYLAGLIGLSAGFWWFERSAANRRLLVFLVACLPAFVVLPWLLGLIVPGAQLDAVTATERLGAEVFALEERPRIWKVALMMFADSPVFGVGFREFGWHHFLLNVQMPEPRVHGFVDHAHNLLLHVMSEFGLVGLTLLLAFAGLWIAGLVRQPRAPANWWLWAAALVVAVHSMLEYPLWYTFFLGVAALVLGLGEPHTLKLQFGRDGRLGRWVFVLLLAMGWLVGVQLYRDYLVLENFLAFRYRYVHASEEVNRKAKEVLLQIRRGSLLAPYVELGLARTISVDADRLEDKLAVNGRAMHLFPIDDVTYRQAMLLALRGDQLEAQRYWDLALASYPELREVALLVLQRRVEDGLSAMRPLLEYAQHPGSNSTGSAR